MTAPRSDALVLFGVTGDLAHKMTFPALYDLIRRGVLTVPVLGVAAPIWSLTELRDRVKRSLMRSVGINDEGALHRLVSPLGYEWRGHRDFGGSTPYWRQGTMAGEEWHA
jgi:glucose-6-phosphate 1-dehydrogenase